jgi:undecaprenyl-diphosphatase
MPPPLRESLVLGAIQGLSEFLPISSDGHLALAEMLFDFRAKGLALNVMLHLGTLLASVFALWPSVRRAFLGGLAALVKPARLSTDPGARDALVVLLASLPTALIGLLLRDSVERWTSSPLAIGLGFLGTSVALLASRFAKVGQDPQPGVIGALLLGVAQGCSVLPGLSRSASTISLALILGVRRERAFELSILMSLPAVVGAVVVEAPGALAKGELAVSAAGALVAFAVGRLGLHWLRRALILGRFSWFALWVVPVSVATLALAAAWPHG